MSGDTLSKVMFGVWLVFFAMWALAFVSGCAAGKPDIDRFLLALYSAVVCSLYWELWHKKAPELHIEIFKLPDGREIRKEHWE